MQHHSQTTDSHEWNDFDLAPESTPHGLLAGGSFRKKITRVPDDPLGPYPHISVQVFADLGLSSSEIARYFGVTERRVIRLKNGMDRHTSKSRLQKFAKTVLGKLLDGQDR